jgi:WD40 repeat protein/DNA-binding winged helix-turn-helix (wHTH) protein
MDRLLFGEFTLDCRSGELSLGDSRIELQPQPARLLALLASRAGEVVTRREIKAALWDVKTFVDFEHGINFAIRQIREALGDNADTPRFLETVPRVGYRFIAPTAEWKPERQGHERSPYPGLASFSVEDSPFFFGREEEVESLWRKLRRRRILALIGPSGSGKTSLLQAGLVPARPPGWEVVVFRPKDKGLSSLAAALHGRGPHPAGVPAGEQEVLALVRQWAGSPGRVLCVDAFEECFTLNDERSAKSLCKILASAANEYGVRVLLAMRDDFFIRCQEHPELGAVFADVTPLRPPQGSALIQALTRPALDAGYRFEDESLIAEILAGIDGERGALPLLAFAMSRLWEKRDRNSRLLTRQAYVEIGGVGGALAQHAEEVLAEIGPEREGIAREIFRNLTTAHGTRLVIDQDELLSVFEDSTIPAQVLSKLIERRLLTAFDISARAGARARPHVEIIHEATLSSWPRLVRWQAQDADDAVLRDQIRHATRMWAEREKREDLLWTGASYRELAIWRERYRGRLTALEESFVQTSRRFAERKRRMRRIALSSLVTAAVSVAIITSSLWQRARAQALQTEAARLVALGRAEVDRFPSAALAFARSSLKLVDTPDARRLVVEALWSGPPARILSLPMDGVNTWSVKFSPDGRWLATFPFSDKVILFPQDGGQPIAIDGHEPPAAPPGLAFTANGRALLTWTPGRSALRMLSVPEGKEICQLSPGPSNQEEWSFEGWAPLGEGVLFGIGHGPENRLELRTCDGAPPRVLGGFAGDVQRWEPDSTGSQLALVREKAISVRPLEGSPATFEREIAKIDAEGVDWVRFSPRGNVIATARRSGELTLWAPMPGEENRSNRQDLQMAKPDPQFPPEFDESGSRLAWGSSADASISIWRLSGPPDSDPMVLRRPAVRSVKSASFHPGGRLLAAATDESITLWELDESRAYVLNGHQDRIWTIHFTPDSQWLVSCGRQDGLRIWPTSPGRGRVRIAGNPVGNCNDFAIAPDGKSLLVAGAQGVHLLPLSGDAGRRLIDRGADGGFYGVAFDATGKRAAAGTGYSPSGTPKLLRIWDLRDASMREIALIPPGEKAEGYLWGVTELAFANDRSLIAGGFGGIRSFDLQTGESRWIWRTEPGNVVKLGLSGDGRHLVGTGFPFAGRANVDHPMVSLDLGIGSNRSISNHGTRVTAIAMDAEGRILVTGDAEGAVRIGALDGGEPHLLLGHRDEVMALAISPDGEWIASAAGSEIRLWPMPDLSEEPLHVKPVEELLTMLRKLTNVEAVHDASSSNYQLRIGPFSGWNLDSREFRARPR